MDAANVATVDPAIPANLQSPDANTAVAAYNTIFTAYNTLNIARTTGANQPLYKLFGDYTLQEGRIKGLRFGVGVQYRGREIMGNRAIVGEPYAGPPPKCARAPANREHGNSAPRGKHTVRTSPPTAHKASALSRCAGYTPTYWCSTSGWLLSAAEFPLHAMRPFSTM